MITIFTRTHLRILTNPNQDSTAWKKHRAWLPRALTLGCSLLLLLLFLTAGVAEGLEVPAPEVHASVALQTEFYGDGAPLLTSFGPGVDRYAVRHVAFEILGRVGARVEYNLEAGVASCMGGGDIKLMEAGVYYRLSPVLRLGVMQGHVFRGFELHQECVQVLTAEKPVWAQTFAPCHPMGVVCDFAVDLEGHTAIEGQLAYLNGADSTLDDEHDANMGLVFRTPVDGLSVAGYYNHVELGLGYSDEWELLHGTGYRVGAGVDYQAHNVLLRAEYYGGRGFEKGVGVGSDETSVEPEDHEMVAYYLEGAYTIATGFDPLPSVQPYVRYQAWDRASNGPEDLEYTYITAGVTIGLGHGDCSLKIDYEAPISTPEDAAEEEASRFVVRLQAGS